MMIPFFVCIAVLIVGFSIALYRCFPSHTKQTHAHYDVCIVLGSPAKEDGSCSRMQKSRLDRAIALYEQRLVSHILLTGSAVVNAYNEADVMAEYAISKGIPSNSILRERQAQNTYDNLRYSKALCEQHGFQRVLVVTSCFHVRRAAFFTKKFFHDFAMVKTLEKERIRHYISEYFRMWNTLRYEWLLAHKKHD